MLFCIKKVSTLSSPIVLRVGSLDVMGKKIEVSDVFGELIRVLINLDLLLFLVIEVRLYCKPLDKISIDYL